MPTMKKTYVATMITPTARALIVSSNMWGALRSTARFQVEEAVGRTGGFAREEGSRDWAVNVVESPVAPLHLSPPGVVVVAADKALSLSISSEEDSDRPLELYVFFRAGVGCGVMGIECKWPPSPSPLPSSSSSSIHVPQGDRGELVEDADGEPSAAGDPVPVGEGIGSSSSIIF